MMIKQKKGLIYFFFLVIVILPSCAENSFEAERIANKYCECMNRERKELDFLAAQVKCDAIFKGNKYFRSMYIEIYYGRYMVLQSKGMQDSVKLFSRVFANTLESKCCKIAVEGCDTSDTFQMRRKMLGTSSN